MYMYGVSSASSLARVLKNVSRHRDEQKQTTTVKMSLFPDESHHRPKGNVWRPYMKNWLWQTCPPGRCPSTSPWRSRSLFVRQPGSEVPSLNRQRRTFWLYFSLHFSLSWCSNLLRFIRGQKVLMSSLCPMASLLLVSSPVSLPGRRWAGWTVGLLWSFSLLWPDVTNHRRGAGVAIPLQ